MSGGVGIKQGNLLPTYQTDFTPIEQISGYSNRNTLIFVLFEYRRDLNPKRVEPYRKQSCGQFLGSMPEGAMIRGWMGFQRKHIIPSLRSKQKSCHSMAGFFVDLNRFICFCIPVIIIIGKTMIMLTIEITKSIFTI